MSTKQRETKQENTHTQNSQLNKKDELTEEDKAVGFFHTSLIAWSSK